MSWIYLKYDDSHIWYGLMTTKKHLFHFVSFAINDGLEILFRRGGRGDWLVNGSFREQYTTLYHIIRDRNDTLVQVLSSFSPNISFRGDLISPHLMSCPNLLSRLEPINLTQGRNMFCWNLTTSRSFTVYSMYHAFTHSEVSMDNNKNNWMSKISFEVKIFPWYLRRSLVLTKDNLACRNWQGSKKTLCIHYDIIKNPLFSIQICMFYLFIDRIASNLYPSTSVINIIGHSLDGIQTGL